MSRFGPRSVARPADAGSTALGTLDAGVTARLDGGGAVQLEGRDWSLDWWIGGEDRWYVPAIESAVRQRRLGSGPVVETMVRVPGGDILQRAGAVVVGGGEGVLIEIENTTSSAVAVAVAIRPVGLDGAAGRPALRFDGSQLRIGDDVLLAERSPVERSLGMVDLAERITAGQVVSDGPASAEGPTANGVLVFPVPHTATLRLALAPATGASLGRLPAIEQVADGWDALLRAGGRIALPDDAVTELADGARTRLLLDGGDGRGGAATWWPMTSTGRGGDVGISMIDAAARGTVVSDPALATAVLEAAALMAADPLDPEHLDLLLESGVASLARIDRRGADRALVARAKLALARLAHRAGQPEAAADLAREATAPRSTVDVAAELTTLVEARGESGRFGAGDDVDAAAGTWNAVRPVLVDEIGVGAEAVLDLAPGHLAAWRGGSLEVIGLRTVFGRLSFAIRWHGERPALLWELDGSEPVQLRCSALDAEWSTLDAKGETLLSGQRTGVEAAPAEGQSFS